MFLPLNPFSHATLLMLPLQVWHSNYRCEWRGAVDGGSGGAVCVGGRVVGICVGGVSVGDSDVVSFQCLRHPMPIYTSMLLDNSVGIQDMQH